MELKCIPNHEKYQIDKNGNVFINNIKLNVYTNKDGYKRVCVDGETVGVHRLLALTFLSHLRKTEHTQVNHRDTDASNNDLNNLEWVTESENNIHSELMRKDNYYPTLYCTKDGFPYRTYINAWDAAIGLNVKPTDIWDSVRNNTSINGYIFYYRSHAQSIPKELTVGRSSFLKSPGKADKRPIKMRDIDTGEVFHYESIHDASIKLNKHSSHIYQAIPRWSYPRIFLKKYQVEYENNEFPILTKDQINKAKLHGARDVIAYDLISKKYYLFKSAKEFIKEFKLSKASVTKTLALNKLKIIDNWVFAYGTITDMQRLSDFLIGSS